MRRGESVAAAAILGMPAPTFLGYPDTGLAAAWSKVLGIPQNQIGRLDHFFDRGGTSLSAVKLAITLDRAVSLKDVLRTPVLADLATLLDASSSGGAAATPAPPSAGTDTQSDSIPRTPLRTR